MGVGRAVGYCRKWVAVRAQFKGGRERTTTRRSITRCLWFYYSRNKWEVVYISPAQPAELRDKLTMLCICGLIMARMDFMSSRWL